MPFMAFVDWPILGRAIQAPSLTPSLISLAYAGPSVSFAYTLLRTVGLLADIYPSKPSFLYSFR